MNWIWSKKRVSSQSKWKDEETTGRRVGEIGVWSDIFSLRCVLDIPVEMSKW